MKRLIVLLLLITTGVAGHAQLGYLFVKKGFHKKRTYTEGDRIAVMLNDDHVYHGLITLLRNDTIWLNGEPFRRDEVTAVIIHDRKKKKFSMDAKSLALITGGVVLATGGLTLSKQAKFGEAAIAGSVIGYGPVLVSLVSSKVSLRRKRYRIGRKFRLVMLEFHLSPKRPF